MTVSIKIDTGNAAFTDNEGAEVARILRRYAEHIDGGGPYESALMDYNGNRVGKVTVTRSRSTRSRKGATV